MNPPIYRIVGFRDDGSRQTLRVQGRLAYYENLDTAIRAYKQVSRPNSSWLNRHLTGIRVEKATADFLPLEPEARYTAS